MKGVSAIIAVILILMIVVALAALAYTWFSGIFTTLTTSASNATTSVTTAMSTNFKIEVARNCTNSTPSIPARSFNISVTLRNVGTAPIDMRQISAYVNDEKINTRVSTADYTSNPGETDTFWVGNVTSGDPSGKSVRLIVQTGLEQSSSISASTDVC